jgi:hypothetical protein
VPQSSGDDLYAPVDTKVAYVLVILEGWVPWDEAILVSAGKPRELVEFHEWTAQFSVWKTTGKGSPEDRVIASQNCAVYSIFPSRMT